MSPEVHRLGTYERVSLINHLLVCKKTLVKSLYCDSIVISIVAYDVGGAEGSSSSSDSSNSSDGLCSSLLGGRKTSSILGIIVEEYSVLIVDGHL